MDEFAHLKTEENNFDGLYTKPRNKVQRGL